MGGKCNNTEHFYGEHVLGESGGHPPPSPQLWATSWLQLFLDAIHLHPTCKFTYAG